MVGEMPDAARAGRLGFVQPGDAVALIAARGWAPSLTGSELAKLRGAAPQGELPAADLGELRAMHAAIRQAVRSGALRSAHDVAEGGVAVALAECCVAGGLGAEVAVDTAIAALFGEGPGAFVVSGPRDAFTAFGGIATVIGIVGGDELRIAGALSVPVRELSAVHADGLTALTS
jgi:phosphoribosylformylglycinamidine synthase subunit PurL